MIADPRPLSRPRRAPRSFDDHGNRHPTTLFRIQRDPHPLAANAAGQHVEGPKRRRAIPIRLDPQRRPGRRKVEMRQQGIRDRPEQVSPVPTMASRNLETPVRIGHATKPAAMRIGDPGAANRQGGPRVDHSPLDARHMRPPMRHRQHAPGEAQRCHHQRHDRKRPPRRTLPPSTRRPPSPHARPLRVPLHPSIHRPPGRESPPNSRPGPEHGTPTALPRHRWVRVPCRSSPSKLAISDSGMEHEEGRMDHASCWAHRFRRPG